MKRMVMTVISTTMIFTALSGQGLWADDIKDLKAEIENLKQLIEQVLTQSTPSRAIMAFDTDECPPGWLEANGTKGTHDLRGEFIRGLDRGRGVDKFYELDEKLNATAKPKAFRQLASPYVDYNSYWTRWTATGKDKRSGRWST